MNAMFSSVYLTKLEAYVMNLCMDIGNILLTMYFVIILASENYPHICTSRASQCSVRDKKIFELINRVGYLSRHRFLEIFYLGLGLTRFSGTRKTDPVRTRRYSDRASLFHYLSHADI